MKKILIDTNAYTAYLAGDRSVLDALAEAGTVHLSIFVLGELYAGFKGENREIDNIAILKKFISKPTVTVLDGSNETAEIFGLLKNALKKAGTPMPINGVWIAAHAMEAGAVVVTYDNHFMQVPGLRLWPGIEQSPYPQGNPEIH
jgi:tRNA(fMet)-specific endonuclease VapC